LGFPGTAGYIVREIPDDTVQALIVELDYRLRAQPDPNIRRRYHNMIDILKKDLDRRALYAQKTRRQELATIARETGRETCECGKKHPTDANFYVTAIDGRKVVPLSGPYATHAEAVAMFDDVRERALAVDPGAAFASFGTTAMKKNYTKRGALD